MKSYICSIKKRLFNKTLLSLGYGLNPVLKARASSNQVVKIMKWLLSTSCFNDGVTDFQLNDALYIADWEIQIKS